MQINWLFVLRNGEDRKRISPEIKPEQNTKSPKKYKKIFRANA
jgi:hypothetical protein